ncbi:MAG: hypothetical protein H6734_02750 [Alphaproteobacteria bacterium]|nr:hypothetical protein [Alphaproteobacteria bacterium]
MRSTQRKAWRVLGGLTFLAILAGCGDIIGSLSGGGGIDPATVEKMKDQDLPGVYQDLKDKDPASLDVESASHLAFVLFSRDELDKADSVLAAAAEKAKPEELPAINLRRAIIARKARKLDDVKKHALASGLPEGKLMAAEVHLTSFDQDAARKLLQEVQGTPGAVGATATKYLELVNGGPDNEALAEITALWALGDRSSACEQAAEVIPQVEYDDDQRKAELQLLWAGRAVTSGHPAVASALLADMTELPSPDQAWRRQAVLAMVAIAEGEYEKGLRIFDQLEEAGAPGQGLADAIGTAIALCKDAEVAKRLAKDLESISVVKGLEVQGLKDEAVKHAPRDSPVRERMK